MNICLIYPVDYTSKRKYLGLDLQDRYFTSPYSISHMGLGYLTAVLREAGHDVTTIEMQLQSKDLSDIKSTIIRKKVEFVGVSSFLYNMKSTYQVVKMVRKNFPNIFIGLGGYQPTLMSERLLKALPVDCCMLGEGENTIRELVGKLERHENWRDIDGISYIGENGKVVFTKPRKLIEDLNELPFPNRQFSSLSTKIANVITSRGCYGTCTYCSINAFYNSCSGSKVRRRTPENVIEEILMLQKNYKIEAIKFNDDNFGIASKNNRKWFERFYTLIKQNHIHLRYWVDIRANEVISAPDILKKFVEIGLESLTMGLESFVNAQLEFYNKHITVEQNLEALKIVNELGIDYDFNLIMFDPRTTVDEIIDYVKVIQNIDFLFEHDNILFPCYDTIIALEGTKTREYVEENGLLQNNSNYYEFKHKDTADVWEARELWKKQTQIFDDYNAIHKISRKFCDKSITAQILNLYREYYYMDLESILYTCELQKKGYTNPKLINMVNEKYGKKLSEYICRLNKLVSIVVPSIK